MSQIKGGWYRKETSDIISLLFYDNGRVVIEHLYFKETDTHYEKVFRTEGDILEINDQYILKLSYLLRYNNSCDNLYETAPFEEGEVV